MHPDMLKILIITLELTTFLHARGYGEKRRTKDIFEASNHEHFLKHHREFRRDVEIPAKRHRTRRNNDPSSKDIVDPKLCPVDPNTDKNRDILKDEFSFVNDSHLSISMSWVGKQSKTILLLATTEFLGIFASQRSALYKSTDFGKSFKEINTDIFNAHIRRNFGIQKSPVDPDRIILVSYSFPLFGASSILFVTTDGAKTWQKFRAPFQVGGAFEFHPRNKDWILARSNLLSVGAYVSTNFGQTWRRLRQYVTSVKWGARQDKKVDKEEKTILLTLAPVLNGRPNINDLELWRSRNVGQRFELLVRHCYTFGIQGRFLFVSVDFNKSNRSRIMHVSHDGGDTFDVAQVPSVQPEQFYSIMDMSEGMVFLHVDEVKDSGKGTLYTSDADGIVFAKSLENHVYTNFDEMTDFYKVESMDGTYTASIMNSDRSLSTVITHDRGGEWNAIKLDPKICNSVPGHKSGDACNLHIHGRFSMSRHVHVRQGPLSEPVALGIIIVHANPGNALTSVNIGIWISRDGGYTWRKVLDGPHHYSIADHGKLLVAIPDEGIASQHLMYSVDEGACWYKYEFTKKPIVFTGLITAPGANTTRFSIWGYTVPSRTWRVITLDFHTLLLRQCVKGDYQPWMAHGNGKNKGCLLGRKITFQRLKADSICYNGEDFETEKTVEFCPCSMADLECEYGYYRKPGETTCNKDPSKKPSLCIGGEAMNVKDRGYRRVPGDVCKKGETDVEKFVDTHERCTNHSFFDYGMAKMQKDDAKKSTSKHSVATAVIVPIMVVLLGILLYFGKKYWDIRKSKPSYQYSALPSEGEPRHDDEDHDMFDPRPNGLQPYHDSDDDAPMIDV